MQGETGGLTIPRSGTLGECQPGNRPVQHVPSRFMQSLSSLMQASLTTSSRLHYERAWKKLIAFHDCLCPPLNCLYLCP